jgi:hypothetical protein
VKVNPAGVKAPSGTVLAGKDLSAFKAEKAHIDSLIAQQPKTLALRQSELG